MATVRLRTLLGFVSAGFLGVAALLGTGSAFANDTAAHSLADKFAHDSDAPPSTDKDRKALERKLDEDSRLRADEAEMLQRAKDEAAELEAQKVQADRDRVADEARKTNEKRLADERAAQERANKETAAKADADRQVEAQRLAAEKADIERQAAEDRRKAEEELAEDKAARERASKEAARIKEAETQRLATEKADVERREKLTKETAEAARQEEARQADAQRRMEAEREDEARRLSEKLARAREQRAAKQGEGYSALGNPPPAEPAPPQAPEAVPLPRTAAVPQPAVAARAPQDIALATPGETRATILLVMEPGTRGIRRYEKTGDPILCIGERCYIGNGIEEAATVMTRGRAFGPGNTLGQRAGACRHSLVCVFRGVEVGAGRFEIQPIDLRILRHDRREKVSVESDQTCTAAAGHLHCSRGAQTASYRAWIVPESVARAAGATALNAALSSGLTATTAASLQR